MAVLVETLEIVENKSDNCVSFRMISGAEQLKIPQISEEKLKATVQEQKKSIIDGKIQITVETNNKGSRRG